jgi:hypothetical protein
MIKMGAETGELPQDAGIEGLSIQTEDDGVIGRM